jgi:triacylglycerol lipase
MMARFLLPDGFGRPPLVALAREGHLAGEATRRAVRGASRARELRRTSYAGRATQRAPEPVLLVPGFLAGDWTLAALAADLRRNGYRTYRSGIHANVGCALSAAAAVEARLESIAERRGARVRIVGHSLGGMIARGIAVRRPDLVSGIVTMGSPMLAPAAHHRLLTGGIGVLTRLSSAGVPGVMSRDCVGGSCAEISFGETQCPLPPGVDMTNVYSRRDGIVDWRACIDPAGAPVEVSASHIGMAVDPRVAEVVLDSLARQPFAHGLVAVEGGATA